jgi:hypothetical protein
MGAVEPPRPETELTEPGFDSHWRLPLSSSVQRTKMHFAKNGPAFRALQGALQPQQHLLFEAFHVYFEYVRHWHYPRVDKRIAGNDVHLNGPGAGTRVVDQTVRVAQWIGRNVQVHCGLAISKRNLKRLGILQLPLLDSLEAFRSRLKGADNSARTNPLAKKRRVIAGVRADIPHAISRPYGSQQRLCETFLI